MVETRDINMANDALPNGSPLPDAGSGEGLHDGISGNVREEKTLSDEGRRRSSRYVADRKRVQARKLFELGFGYRRVAGMLGLSVNTVHEWGRLWKKGRFTDAIRSKQYVFTDEAKAEAVRMRLSGASWREIHDALGANPPSVRRWMQALASEDEETPPT